MNIRPRQFAIAADTTEAAVAGLEIAAAGGNAADAAVAGAFELLVSAIIMASLGGGGFAIIRTPDGKVEFIDFFDSMPGKGVDFENYKKIAKPKKIHLDYGLGYDVMAGHACVSVPGAARGLEMLHKRHGRMPFKELLQPAIRNARRGTKFNKNIYDFFSCSAEQIQWGSEYCKNILSTAEGTMPDIDTFIYQHDLANALEMIAEEGSDAIYNGDLGKAMVKEVQDGGGLLTFEDLQTYQPIIRKPCYTNYRGKHIWTNPAPAVGGVTMVEMLNIISHRKFGKKLTPEDVAVIGKAQRQALYDKFNKYVDPNTNEEVSKELLSPEYAMEHYKKIQPSPHTTHLSCLDTNGFAVALTMSMGYGSGVTIPGTGIFMNNSLGEIDLNPRGYLQGQPGDKLISAMAPSIMYDPETEDLFAMGSAASARISSSLMHFVMNVTDFDMTMHDAVFAPRCHYEDFEFAIESGIEVDESLLDKKTKVCWFNTFERFFGGTNIVRHKKGKMLEACNDPRRSGGAITSMR